MINKAQTQNSKSQDKRVILKSIIENCKLKIVNSLARQESGFTLVELLASMVAFVVVGGMVATIIITTFRTSNRTDTITLVRQNGNYALTQMAKTIRNARVLSSPYPCVAVSPTPVSSVTILTVDNNQITYSCVDNPSPTPATIASNGASLLDTNSVNLVISSCSFTCTQFNATSLPLVTIQFSLTQKLTSNFADQLASGSAVPFEASVVVRNINR